LTVEDAGGEPEEDGGVASAAGEGDEVVGAGEAVVVGVGAGACVGVGTGEAFGGEEALGLGAETGGEVVAFGGEEALGLGAETGGEVVEALTTLIATF